MVAATKPAVATRPAQFTGADAADGRRRRGDESRRAILDAAARVIVNDGVAALTYRAVAEAAGVPLARVSYHFATVDDLMVAAATDYVEAFDNRLQELADAARSARRSMVEACTDFLHELVTVSSREFLGMVEVRLALHRGGRSVNDVRVFDIVRSFGADDGRAAAVVSAMFGFAVLAASAPEPVGRRQVRSFVQSVLGDAP